MNLLKKFCPVTEQYYTIHRQVAFSLRDLCLYAFFNMTYIAFIFILWSAVIVKSSSWQVIFFLSINTKFCQSLGSSDPFISHSPEEFYASYFLGHILVCSYKICQCSQSFAQFPVDHFSHPVVSSLVFYLCQFTAFVLLLDKPFHLCQYITYTCYSSAYYQFLLYYYYYYYYFTSIPIGGPSLESKRQQVSSAL